MELNREIAGRLRPVGQRSPQILLVEDEVLIRMFISDALRDEGFDVIEAYNGDEAADILKSGAAIDLIFSDVRMPGTLDGIGLLEFVRQRFGDIPVILTSGHLDARVAMAAGAKHMLPKPYQVAVVLALITGALDASE